MKKSELRQIIREEIQNILKDGKADRHKVPPKDYDWAEKATEKDVLKMAELRKAIDGIKLDAYKKTSNIKKDVERLYKKYGMKPRKYRGDGSGMLDW